LSIQTFGGISIPPDGIGNRTLTLEYTHPEEKVLTTLEDASEYLYTHKRIALVYDAGTLVEFDDLTNQQKLNVVFIGIRKILIQWAKANRQNVAIDAARESVANEDVLITE
jgi:hypothetical protein